MLEGTQFSVGRTTCLLEDPLVTKLSPVSLFQPRQMNTGPLL